MHPNTNPGIDWGGSIMYGVVNALAVLWPYLLLLALALGVRWWFGWGTRQRTRGWR